MTLVERLTKSLSNQFLMAGPPCPDEGWKYIDFSPMPQSMWLELLDIFGTDHYRMIAANTKHLPPEPMCRAQLWISPEAQERMNDYIKSHTNLENN